MGPLILCVLCLFLSGCVSVESLGEISLGNKGVSQQPSEGPFVLNRPAGPDLNSLSTPMAEPGQRPLGKMEPISQKAGRPSALTKIDSVKLGMAYSEVAALMGNGITTGYEQSEYLKGAYKPIVLKNPYRAEVFKDNSRVYTIEYYFTHIKKEDGVIADDELTPLIFENRILLGMGWDFLTLVKGSPAF
jgi:hypothetical protein